MNWSVHCADVLSWCEDYAAKIERGEAEPFHASLGDWPYELSFMGKRWDATGVSFQPETWEAIASVLYPGGFILAFGGSRTYHRLAVAAEDAGLIVHPALVWLNGQGFPKATRIDTQIDKAAGAEREVIGINEDYLRRKPNGMKTPGASTYNYSNAQYETNADITAPATLLAAAWAGHRYGLQALKPCAEFILCAQKPYEGKPVDCITSTGAGALNIDGARVATGERLNGGTYSGNTPKKIKQVYGEYNKLTPEDYQQPAGRWPPNVCISHVPPRPDGNGGWLPGCERLGVKRVRGRKDEVPETDEGRQDKSQWRFRPTPQTSRGYADLDGTEPVTAYACVLACDACGHQWTAEQRGACPECGGEGRWACAVGELGEQSGERKSGGGVRLYNGSGFMDDRPSQSGKQWKGSTEPSTGTAARFYPQHAWQHEIAERLPGVLPFRCSVCLHIIPKHSIMSETQSGGSLCDNANGAETNLTLSEENSDFVATDVAQSQLPESGGKQDKLHIPVNTVARSGKVMQETSGCIVQKNAQPTPEEQNAQIAKSAANLCDLCATAIVQSLVLGKQCPSLESILGQLFIPEYKKQVLTQSLVSNAESQELSDITQIMTDPTILSGFVKRVITDYIQEIQKLDQTQSRYHEHIAAKIAEIPPFIYKSKASRAQRDAGLEGMPLCEVGRGTSRACTNCDKPIIGLRQTEVCNCEDRKEKHTAYRNPHPTVKNIELTKWLATLLLPPPEYAPRRILVPFGGVMSEAIGAALAGWDEIVAIEMEEEYIPIGEARLRFWADWAARGYDEPAAILKAAKREETQREEAQMELL